MKRLTVLALLAVLAVAASLPALARAHASKGTTLYLKADKAMMKYDKKTLKARAGRITIVMTNPAPMPHNVAIRGKGVKVVGKIVMAGGKSVVTATLKRGTYVFYCSVPGHEQAGMKGKLVVT
ncbi:MAG TPA: plastocyanin/azurin family copper-binding protein [Gaiellaceae bacterium]|nr:plastocyanin/azurin family copper-binding protein [Gaiellaceae bacterium]